LLGLQHPCITKVIKWPSKYSEADDLIKEVDILLGLQHPCITKVLKWPSKYSEPDDLFKEVDILVGLQHPCITKALNMVVDSKFFIILSEYAAVGNCLIRL